MILEGSYKTHDTINHVQEDFDHNQKNLKRFSTPHHMHDVFINIMLKYTTYMAGKMVSYNNLAGLARYSGTGSGNYTPMTPASKGLKT